MSDARTPGALRLSKGTWLFAPDGVDVLLRVDPRPAPSMEGFFSQPVRARLEVQARSSSAGGAAPVIEPRTGVPDRIAGRVVAIEGGAVIIDAGIPFAVGGVVAAVGDGVDVVVDIDAGVTCVLG